MVKSIFKARRLLLKESKYKRIIIDDSDAITLETYDDEALHLWCEDEQSNNDRSRDEDEEDKEDEIDEIEKEDEEDKEIEEDEIYEIEIEDDEYKEDDEDMEEDEIDEIEKDEEEDEVEKKNNKKHPLQRKQQDSKKQRLQQQDIEPKEMPNNYIEMGKDLYVILKNICKLPTPPPTNNPQYTTNKYRSILVNHLTSIENVDKFALNIRDIFIPVDEPSASSTSPASVSKLSINFIIDVDVESVDPKTLINLPIDDFEKKQTEVCELITNKIINIYEVMVKDQVTSELLRRSQFNNLILLLKYYEKLEVFCNLHLTRNKGKTVKAQAIKMIVRLSKPSKDKPPYIKGREITVVLSQAVRIRRLLNLAKNDFNIFYAFPDLHPQFFLPKKLNVVNFERWLKLVETGILPSVEIGRKLYNEYKEEIKKRRLEKLDI